MIEKLKNCPSCGGILNEAGRCQFCGSKVYDFLTIDFPTDPFHWPNAKTYIRLKHQNKIVLAPVIIHSVEKTFSGESYTDILGDGYRTAYAVQPVWTTLDVSFGIVGECVEIDTED